METVKFSGEASKDAMKSSLDRRLKAQPAAGAGYVPMRELAKDDALPFDKAWIKQGVDWKRYRTIYIAPVNTELPHAGQLVAGKHPCRPDAAGCPKHGDLHADAVHYGISV